MGNVLGHHTWTGYLLMRVRGVPECRVPGSASVCCVLLCVQLTPAMTVVCVLKP
jgi:hypothetical protein